MSAKRHSLIVLGSLAILSLLWGCPGSPYPIDQGIVDAGVFDTSTLADPNTSPTAGRLDAQNLPVKVDALWTLAGATQRYSVLAGAYTAGEFAADGSITVEIGWCYVAGSWPYVRTSRVSAGVEGSQIVVQTNADQDAVYFVGGTQAWLRPPKGPEIRWSDTDVFYTVGADGSAKEHRRSQDQAATAFLDQVLTLVGRAGLEATESAGAAVPLGV